MPDTLVSLDQFTAHPVPGSATCPGSPGSGQVT